MQNNLLDILHRGYLAYHQTAESDNDYRKLRQVILNTDPAGEFCDILLRTCDIKTDWIEAIEAALPFVERAVNENRQFILRQGEIVPIEKVRRVSKTSVEHLARHSEMITREPAPGDDIIPEKILMTENVGTYTVYENRFLYMLLCYVKDFVQIKYSKITDLSNAFSSETVFEKNLSNKNQKISFSLKYKETATGVTLPEHSPEAADCLQRMKNLLSTVDALLKTNLMIEVSLAPMLKPPITRTNVLMHNPCFVAAVDLYDYLCAYSGDGYTVRDLYQHTGDLMDEARSDYAELVALVSYLSYRQGGLHDALDARYAEAEEERRAEERRIRDLRIEELKAQVKDITPEAAQYILALEDKCKEAEAEADELARIRQLVRTAENKLAQAADLRAAVELERKEMKDELHQRDLRERAVAAQHQKALDDLHLTISEKEAAMQTLIADHAAELESLTEKFRQEYAALAEEYHLQGARLHAMQAQSGTTDQGEDCSSKEAFAKLEAEYSAFKRFFNAQWKIAKKRIRRDHLWKKSDQ